MLVDSGCLLFGGTHNDPLSHPSADLWESRGWHRGARVLLACVAPRRSCVVQVRSELLWLVEWWVLLFLVLGELF